MENLHVELNGIVVKPDEVLVVVMKEATLSEVEAANDAFAEAGLRGRAVILVGEAKLASVTREL